MTDQAYNPDGFEKKVTSQGRIWIDMQNFEKGYGELKVGDVVLLTSMIVSY